jgi:hypothetical protein
VATAVAFGAARAADAGWLDIRNRVDGAGGDCSAVHYDDPGISDGKDTWDTSWLAPPSGSSAIYSDIDTDLLSEDYRLPTSDSPFMLELVYNGALSSPAANQLELSMPYDGWKFEHKSYLTLRQVDESGGLLGPVWDVRDVIANDAGQIDLDPLQGSYSTGDPYMYLRLDFEPAAEGSAVPEPSGLALLALVAVGLIKKKRS